MKALVVAPQPFFSYRGTPLSVYHRTLVMAELGVEIDLLTYGEGHDVEIPGVRILRIPRLRALEPVPVGPSWRKALLDVPMVLWTIALLLRRRYDVVHAHEEAVFFCRYLAPLFRTKLIYDMHSSLPQQLSNFAFTRSRLLIGLFDRLERGCLKRADAVITISPSLARYAESKMPDPSRHVLIENSIFDPVRLSGEAPDAAAGGGLPDLPTGEGVIVYAGTFEAYQGIELLLRAFALLLERRPISRLLLIGGRPDQVEAARALAESLGIEDAVMLTGVLPQETARAALRGASLVVSPRVTGTNTPLKVYELLASGVPIVATAIESHTQVLDGTVCFLTEPEARAMADVLERALADPGARSRVVEAARALYDERYARPVYVRRLRRLLERLS